jgi:hypothetical protein
MSMACNCAEALLAFLAGSDIAQDILSNKPAVFMQRQVPDKVLALGREGMIGQFLTWMIAGAQEMKHACRIDTDATVENLTLASQQLAELDDEKLRALIIQSANEVHLALSDCALIEMAVERGEPIQVQESALGRLGEYRLVKKHDDGNVTVETKEGKFMVDTSGEVFKEVTFGG